MLRVLEDGKSSVASAANFPDFQGLIGVSTPPDETEPQRAGRFGAPRQNLLPPFLKNMAAMAGCGWTWTRRTWLFYLFLSVLLVSYLSSTISTPADHTSTSHEPANAPFDLPCARSYSLSAQPIRDSLYCWQKISPCLKGSFNRSTPH